MEGCMKSWLKVGLNKGRGGIKSFSCDLKARRKVSYLLAETFCPTLYICGWRHKGEMAGRSLSEIGFCKVVCVCAWGGRRR